jgi:hypothetical protein
MTVSGNRFAIKDIVPGEYRLTVSNPGRATRSYPVKVFSEDVSATVTLCRIGDVNADGDVNLGDVAKIYAHIRQTAVIKDSYELLCADYDQNGMINLGDVAYCYATIRRI